MFTGPSKASKVILQCFQLILGHSGWFADIFLFSATDATNPGFPSSGVLVLKLPEFIQNAPERSKIPFNDHFGVFLDDLHCHATAHALPRASFTLLVQGLLFHTLFIGFTIHWHYVWLALSLTLV